MITQQCSCYWINITDLETKFGIVTADKYQFQFKGRDMDSLSGFFRLETSPKKVVTSTTVVTSSTVAPRSTPAVRASTTTINRVFTSITTRVSTQTPVRDSPTTPTTPESNDTPKKNDDAKKTKPENSGVERLAISGMLVMGALALI